jgi:formate C-acetyltransferase
VNDSPGSIDALKEMQKKRSAVRPINARIVKLREQGVLATVSISGERAALVTNFYQSGITAGKSFAVQRALAFKYLMDHVSLPVEDGQLIAGLRGTGPQEAPTYPEMCTRSLQDLAILNTRENMPHMVDDQITDLYKTKVIPAWKSNALRDIIFDNLPGACF